MTSRFRAWFRSVFMRRRLDREMRDEMEAHLERAAERLVARGLSPTEARREARREFGNVEYLQELGREARGSVWVASVAGDLRFALRHFRRSPLATAAILLLLTLGIGANTGLTTVVHSLLTRPAPGIQPDPARVRIRALWRDSEVRTDQFGREMSYTEIRGYAGHPELFSRVVAWSESAVVLDLGGTEVGSLAAVATFVDDGYFDLLGVVPILGGLPASEGASESTGAVVGHALWFQHFGGDPDILGRTVYVNEVAVTIVGVAPARFAGVNANGPRLGLWLPLGARSLVAGGGPFALSSPDSAFLSAAARLRSGVTTEQATRALQAAGLPSVPAADGGRRQEPLVEIVPLRANNANPRLIENIVVETSVAGAFALLFLIVTCTNVSGLLVGLAASRRHEIGVRLALGASRGRLIRQLVTESVMLAMVAGALALGVTRLLVATFAEYSRDVDLTIAWPVVLLTMGMGLGAGFLFGLSPASHATRIAVSQTLKDSAAAIAASGSRLQQGLVVAQVALTLPLLVVLFAIGLVVLDDWRGQPPSTLHDRVVSVEFSYSAAMTDVRRGAIAQLEERISALPGVVDVVAQPWGHPVGSLAVHPDDRTSDTRLERVRLEHVFAAPGYFALMDISFVRGRDFDDSERQANSVALVIGSDFAREMWGSADPIGRRFVRVSEGEESGEIMRVVIGVVDEENAGSSRSGSNMRVYVPYGLSGGLLVRTDGLAAPLIPVIRSIAAADAPDLPISRAETLSAKDARQQTLLLQVGGAVAGGGLLALFLSAMGLYALVAFSVVQRTREIGVRLALGADRSRIVGEFFTQGMRLCFLGIVLGLPLGLVGLRVMVAQMGMREVSTPTVLSATVLVVLAVTSLATVLPARRAAGLDPTTVLRMD